MLTAHHVNAFLVIAICLVAAGAAFLARRRGRAGASVAQSLALAQTLIVAQVGLGLLLLSDHRRASDHLHYAYGTLALLVVDIGWWLTAHPSGRDALAFILVAAACVYAGVRIWRDQKRLA